MLSTIFTVLLTILKIIGIILLLILSLILLILLVSIHYDFEVDVPEEGDMKETLKVGAGISWFLVLLKATASLLGTKLSYEVNVLGKTILGNDPEYLKQKEEKARKKEEKKAAREKKDQPGEPPVPPDDESIPEQVVSDEGESIPEQVISDEGEPETDGSVSVPEEVLPEYSPTKTPSTAEAGKGEDVKEKENKTPLSEKLESLSNKIGEVNNKIEEGKKFLDEYQVIRLAGIAKDALIKLLKHLLPRRIKGWILYGFSDPATTGYVEALAKVFYPAYYRNFSLEPDFMEARFAGQCQGKGRIRLGYLLWILITLLVKKEVRKLIRFILKK